MAAPTITISEILKSKSEFEDEPKKKSREDWRKAKELEEARKAGTAPAAVDEEGRDINPHIPQYISTAPWYFGSRGPTLKHQRPQDEKQPQFSGIDDWYKRGVDSAKIVTKFRKGACENCGAMTHMKKDCMERPRKIGAKFTGQAIASDEFAQPNLAVDYDGKRDRWNGYNPSEHRAIIEEFQKVEEAKRELKAEKLKNGEAEEEEDEHREEDDDKYVDEVDMPGTKVDSKQRITVRNLRIREDTAKYLRNLDPNSAYYDPKTRSMRDNPNELTKEEAEEEDYAGENFVRFSGDTRKHAKAQLFAWEAYEKGVDVHLLAEPTKLERLQHEYEERKESYKSKAQGSILDRYGGEEHLKVPPKSLLLAQTETYVEYSRHGKIIKGQDKPVIRSKYEEDQLINNHTSVWGSYWSGGYWGYRCCHSFVKNSYCVGEVGLKEEVDEDAKPSTSQTETTPAEKHNFFAPATTSSAAASSAAASRGEDAASISDKQKTGEKRKEVSSSSSSSSSSDSESDEEVKLKKAQRKQKKKLKKKMRKEKKKLKKLAGKAQVSIPKDDEYDKDDKVETDERKRGYNSMYEVKAPTEEEIETYYKKRKQFDDPMSQFM